MENSSKQFFTMPEDETLLSSVESLFFIEAIRDDEDYLLSKNIMEIINHNPEDKARQLYEIADYFKTQIVEGSISEMNLLKYNPYQNILFEAIYSVDSFKIAKELLSQFENKLIEKVA